MKTVTIGDVTLGEGRPKIIVPIVGQDETSILEAAECAHNLPCDLIEWRIDFYHDVKIKGAVATLSHKVKEAIKKPLLITFRSEKEGGEVAFSDEEYIELYHQIIGNGSLDLLDIELFMPKDAVQDLIKAAQLNNIKVVMCNHDFYGTPEQAEIVKRLTMMQERGADICKIAVMPQNEKDVLTLLSATVEMKLKSDQPIITMSMGALGMVSRVSGEVFGSAATFGTAGTASAPGQMPVSKLKGILEDLKLVK